MSGERFWGGSAWFPKCLHTRAEYAMLKHNFKQHYYKDLLWKCSKSARWKSF